MPPYLVDRVDVANCVISRYCFLDWYCENKADAKRCRADAMLTTSGSCASLLGVRRQWLIDDEITVAFYDVQYFSVT